MLSRDADAILIGHMSGRRSEHYFYYQAPYKRGEFKAAMDKNHILIVEDDADIRSGIEIYLKNQGYDVSQAGDGIEGLAVIEKEEIDIEAGDKDISIVATFKPFIEEIEEEDKTVLISDIKQGRCSKSIRFSNNIEIDKISAKFNNGTVLITIPKLKTPKNKINVE